MMVFDGLPKYLKNTPSDYAVCDGCRLLLADSSLNASLINSTSKEVLSVSMSDKVLQSGTIEHTMVKLLVTGSVNGKFEDFFKKVTGICEKHGPFAAILCTGEFFGEEDSLDALVNGIIKIPVSTYVITGKVSIPEKIQIKLNSTGEICENLVLLNSSGILTTCDNLYIAFLNGLMNPSAQLPELQSVENSNPFMPESNVYYSNLSIASLLESAKKYEHSGIDLLLTCEWPEGIHEKSDAYPQKFSNGCNALVSSKLTDVVAQLKPKYHFGGASDLFFEREPYFNDNGTFTRFISLGSFGSESKQRWFYAMNIIPGVSNQPTPPANCTENPFFIMLPGNDSYFHENQKGKRKREPKLPPETYLCKICQEPGHWIQDCPQKEVRERRLPEGYVCRICNESGHHIKDCPQAGESRPRKTYPCWFCLSNPDIEKHLIVTIGEEVYVTIAKGGLNDHHILAIPIPHYPSLNHLTNDPELQSNSSDCLKEMSAIQQKVFSTFTSLGLTSVSFELFPGYLNEEDRMRTIHTHVQMIALEKSVAKKLKEILKDEAAKEGLELIQGYPTELKMPYVHFELSTGETYTYVPSETRIQQVISEQEDNSSRKRFKRSVHVIQAQFARLVIALALNCPANADWKCCVLSQEEETKATDKLKSIIVLDE